MDLYMNRDTLIKYLIMNFGFVFAEFLIMLSDNTVVHIAAMILFSLLAIIVSSFDLLHPYTWFSSFFCLYSIGLAVLTVEGSTNLRAVYTKESMEIQLLAMFIVLLIISPKKIDYEIDDIGEHSLNLGIFNKILYIGMILILLGGAIYLSRSGLGGKANIYSSGNTLLIAVFRVPLILTMLYTLLIVCEWKIQGTISIRTILITGISLLGITMYSGERDFLFRFILITGFFLFSIGKLKKKHFIILIPAAVAILILSDQYKYFMSTGVINESSGNLITELFSGEFASAGTNLQIVINNGMTNSWGLERYLLDVASAFTTNITSASSWFSELFYSGRDVQYGFSIVGEGYVTGGVVGVVFISILLGLIIRFFYRKSSNGIYWRASYLYFITIVIYSIRMDLGTVLSSIVKQIVIVVVIVMIAESLSKDEIRGE